MTREVSPGVASGVYRDRHGIPHLRAASVLDLARLQGEVTARDRAWQLEYLRRRATGTSAAVLGPAMLEWDRMARRCGLVDLARRSFSSLGRESHAFVVAYVEGVNAGLASHGGTPETDALGIGLEPWEEWMPLAVFAAQHLLFANLGSKLWWHSARQVLGDEADLLSRESVPTNGSNFFAVGAGRTASGLPLIAGDPHRVIEAPGVYQQVRLACTDPDDPFDVVGFAFPGVPGVQHFAHAGEVAWAITNAMADYQDVYAEQLREAPDDTADGVEVLGPYGWEPARRHTETIEVRGGEPETVEVIRTRRGPVFEGGTAAGSGLSLRAPSLVVGELGFDALLPLLRARTVADVDSALERWVEPVNNVVTADVHGGFRYRVAGLVPERAEANRRGIVDAADPESGWTGWVGPLPRHELGPDDQVTNGNERRGPESDPLGVEFAPPYRADRLAELLRGRTDLTAADLAACHADVRQPVRDLVVAFLDGIAPESAGEAGERVRRRILDWDGEMAAESAGAAAYVAWRNALTARLAADPVFAPLRGVGAEHTSVLAASMDLPYRIGHVLEALLAASARGGRPFGLDVAALATAALGDAADHAATWGSTHRLEPLHAFELAGLDSSEYVGIDPPAVGGDFDCVRCTGSSPGLTDVCQRGSVARYVWDLADPARGGWVVPLGAHGDVRHPHHHDQLEAWTAVELVPIVLDWAELTRETVTTAAPAAREG